MKNVESWRNEAKPRERKRERERERERERGGGGGGQTDREGCTQRETLKNGKQEENM